MSNMNVLSLPDPPQGFRFYRSREEILRSAELFAYQHMLLRAWEEMHLSGVLTLNGIPTVYIREESKPVTARVAAEAHGQFWNQGIATVLLLRDPEKTRVFSSMTTPADPQTATEAEMEERLVEKIDLATQASWAHRFYYQLGTGNYYAGERESKFDPEHTVDTYLIRNLAAVRDELVAQALPPKVAHAFLGRLLFTCYLCDRGIIELPNYFKGNSWRRLHELLEAFKDPSPAFYDILFPALSREFNGSMFDENLQSERTLIRPGHFNVIRRFLYGDDLAGGHGQRSLGFWAYNFKFIPIETISAIYENFLDNEDGEGKRVAGAFYTPRLLAEMALDLALEGIRPLFTEGRLFLDPACGSGIFLVLLFNRLAGEWRIALQSEPTAQEKAEALLERLDSLRGIDKNSTACRIACFSLYLAFLDQFDPPDVRAYKLHTGKKLPNLLHLKGARKNPEHPIVYEEDFFDIESKWRGQFDLVIGNPPWAGRGTKQIAQQFMDKIPDLLKETGHSCLLLPSKVFLNQTDDFQSRWLHRVTLEKVIQLADYRFILFKEALCPCNIVLFTSQKPDEAKHEIEYVTPKVSCADLRDGVIQVAAKDRKWLPLRFVLAASEQKATSVAWKSHLWGTPRDLKFLDYLFTLPRLGDLAGTAKQMKSGKTRWCKGQGFQPLRTDNTTDKPHPIKWSLSDPFVSPERIVGLFVLPNKLTYKIGSYFADKGYRVGELRRAPDERIYEPPLILLNQGFSTAAFFDYEIRFQDSLQSISGRDSDADYLIFLTVVLRSKIARYMVFHTAANLGTERDKVHMFEVLRLPFFLPDNPAAQPNAESIVKKIIYKVRKLKDEMEISAETLAKKPKRPKIEPLFDEDGAKTEAEETSDWFGIQRENARKLQAELEPLIYDYFGLNDQERALVEDTCEIFDKSDTPGSLEAARKIPTLEPVNADGLKPYAVTLTETLNGWATGNLRISAFGGVDNELGIGLITLSQTRNAQNYDSRNISPLLATALQRLQEQSIEYCGHIVFQRSGLIFEGSRIHLVKPALRGEWTRTAALNDAIELSAHIAEARRQKRKK
jgi:hypothetical protein